MNTSAQYRATPIKGQNGIEDIQIHIATKIWHLWGRNAHAKEIRLTQQIPDNTLPVIIGSGLGHCIKALIDSGRPVAVIDRELPLIEASGLEEYLSNTQNLTWLYKEEPQQVLTRLARWQREHGGKALSLITLPIYLRLNRDYYGSICASIKTSAQTNFWDHARYPKFRHKKPRILFFDSDYFLCDEITTALQRLEIAYTTLPLKNSETGSTEFIALLLQTIIDFKPDFVLTVNHFGLDREGKLITLLADLNLPLASWFVDNPHLILHDYAHPHCDNTVIFTYDAGNITLMRGKGFENVHYLPLATDPERFKTGAASGPNVWSSKISFVGNSMVYPVQKTLQHSNLPTAKHQEIASIAADFDASDSLNVLNYFNEHRPDWQTILEELPTPESRLALESLITWEATRQYRLSCVNHILPFSPLIVGDQGWREQLPPQGWRHIERIDYYEELPRFYPMSKINFNSTSRQMVGAVNQRVFDAPACGAFLLTDYRSQMEELFDLDTEVVTYSSPDEIDALVEQYLRDDTARKKVTIQARKRIIAEHTYEIRMNNLIQTVASTFS